MMLESGPVSPPEKGVVLTGRNNIFTVLHHGSEYLCRLRGKRLEVDERAYNPLAPGDLVRISDLDKDELTGVIEERLPRENSFARFNRKRSAPQTLAANIARAVCVVSVREPAFRTRFVDRFLALAEDQGVRPGIIINKADLDTRAARRLVRTYADLGYQAIAVAGATGKGVPALSEWLGEGRAVFVGQSGVGKSTLLNAIAGKPLQRVGQVSRRFARGRHTTNAARLVRLGALEVVDTPGIRELDIRTVAREHLDWCFVEFRRFLGHCEHSDCGHASEPGCLVVEAVEAGMISAERYESYLKLSEELRELENMT